MSVRKGTSGRGTAWGGAAAQGECAVSPLPPLPNPLQPLPSALWPTSELPMSSSDGRPTALPWACVEGERESGARE